MSSAENRATGRIVVGVDGSTAATEAVRWAAAEAKPRKLGVHLVHAFAPIVGDYGVGLPVPMAFFDELKRAGLRLLGEAASVARAVDSW